MTMNLSRRMTQHDTEHLLAELNMFDATGSDSTALISKLYTTIMKDIKDTLSVQSYWSDLDQRQVRENASR